jgi:hypothetical protein
MTSVMHSVFTESKKQKKKVNLEIYQLLYIIQQKEYLFGQLAIFL